MASERLLLEVLNYATNYKMNKEELNLLKMDIYKLYGKNRGKKVMDVYRRVLALIDYTEELQYALRSIRDIGGKHPL